MPAPPAPARRKARQEETTNYEISKTVRTLIHEQPQIDRISLAVMVDGTDSVGADGKHVRQPRSAEELDRIATLVKSAIGFDEKRGDQVDVVSMRFADDEAAPPPDTGGLFGFRLEKADLMRLAQTGLFGLVGIAGFAAGAAADGGAADRAGAGRRRWPSLPRRAAAQAALAGPVAPRALLARPVPPAHRRCAPACPRRRCWKTRAW